MKEDVLFVIGTNRNEDDRKINRFLDIVLKKFLNQYGHLVKDWNGKIKIFESFKKDLDLIFESTTPS